MKLLFGNLTEIVYKQWKHINNDSYKLLKATILDAMEHPHEGIGSPYKIDYKGGNYWCRTFGSDKFVIYSINGDKLQIDAVSSVGNHDIEYSDAGQHDDAINLMKRFFDNGRPKLGIFWYDYRSQSLFGVEKGDAELYSNQGKLSTFPKLHKTYWQKMHYRALANNDVDSVFYGEHDYTQIPRGRVFLDNGSFYVNVGNWINGYIDGKKCIDKEELRRLILDEFNLPEDFKFRQDVHWNIGHGWSEEQFQ